MFITIQHKKSATTFVTLRLKFVAVSSCMPCLSTQCIANYPHPLSSENGQDMSPLETLRSGLTLGYLNGPLQDNFLLSLTLLLSHSSIKGSFIANSPTEKSVAEAYNGSSNLLKCPQKLLITLTGA